MKSNFQEGDERDKEVELHPSLENVVKEIGLDRSKLSVGLQESRDKGAGPRELVFLYDGRQGAPWTVSSVRELFRGSRPAPHMPNEPPPGYFPLFMYIEKHMILYCDTFGDKTDGEFEEAFSNIRRRPDGKTVSDLHSFLWQVAAVMCGIYPISAAEFEGIFDRLARSARTFGMGPVSRNYIGVLRRTIP